MKLSKKTKKILIFFVRNLLSFIVGFSLYYFILKKSLEESIFMGFAWLFIFLIFNFATDSALKKINKN